MGKNSKVEWDSEQKRYVILEFAFKISWNEFHEGVREAHDLINRSRHPVGLLIISKGPLPKGNAMANFRVAFLDQPKKVSKVVVAMGDTASYLERFIQILVSIFSKTMPKQSRKFQIVRSVEAGRALLETEAQAGAQARR